jgi:chorismate--pyruvate lyase
MQSNTGGSGRLARMKSKPAVKLQSIQWLPIERLGQMPIDSALRPWLIGKGMLSVRLREAYGDGYGLRMIHEWSGTLSSSQRLGLRVEDEAGLFRDVELFQGAQVWVFGQTITPDSTLCVHPWLAELGDTPLDETMHGLSGVERGPFEYAWLPDSDPLIARALRAADIKPAGLWVRRRRVALRGAPLLMQEVFLPGVGRA